MSKSEVAGIFESARQQGRNTLSEPEAKRVLALAGLDVTRETLATSAEEAGSVAEKMGFPVVLKVASADVPHKSDAGGVVVGLNSSEAVRKAFAQIMESVKRKHPNAKIQGILVQEMISGGVETIVGITNKKPFGPVVAFGLGGVFVELLKDVTFRLAPVDEPGAAAMLGEIQAARMLDGYRGGAAADKQALARAIGKLSQLAIDFKDDIEEVDVNPLAASGKRAVALDALIVLKARDGAGAKAPAAKPRNSIDSLLEPRSIAVLGASPNPDKTGHILLKNIIANGYPGKIYPINPKADEILGHKSYPSILDVPGDIDLVFFLVPGESVPKLFEACKQKNVKAAVVIAGGFSEVGEEGEKAQRLLESLIAETGVRVVGPNTIGFVNTDAKLIASFAFFENWEDGPIALAAQSGIFAGAVADELMFRKVQRIGIGTSLPFGNKVDLDESDFVEWAARKDKVKVIALHVEGMRNPRRFFSLANRVKKEKPIIVLKSGRTTQGAQAAASHTGSLAVDDVLVDNAFRQYGLIRAYDMQEFLEYMKAFSYLPLPKGNRVGIATFSGASAVMASDELTSRGFEIAKLTAKTAERAKKFLPPWQPARNPLDLWAALGAGNRLAHEEGLLSVLDDENVDAVMLILVALKNADFDGMREVYIKARERHPDKPLLTVMEGGETKEKWLHEINGLQAPVFETTEVAAKALDAMRRYALSRDRIQPDPLI